MFPSLFVFVCLLALNIFEVFKKCLGLLKYAGLTSPLLTQSREAAVLLTHASLCWDVAQGQGCSFSMVSSTLLQRTVLGDG